MYWTLELASKLEDAPWPATKDELIDYAIRSGAPLRCWRIFRRLRMRAMCMTVSKIFGLIILQRMIFSGTKTNIDAVY